MAKKVGVVSIQGDFEKHIDALKRCGVSDGSIKGVRVPEDLDGVGRVIIPGGESTTVGKLMERFGLGESLVKAANEGMPIWGTCMGMILMARDLGDYSHQYRLGILDVTVQRNAFGPQVHSFEAPVDFEGEKGPVLGVFIRAPIVTRLGKGVQAIATFDGKTVGVRQGKLVGTSFHPELTDDLRIHRWFLGL